MNPTRSQGRLRGVAQTPTVDPPPDQPQTHEADGPQVPPAALPENLGEPGLVGHCRGTRFAGRASRWRSHRIDRRCDARWPESQTSGQALFGESNRDRCVQPLSHESIAVPDDCLRSRGNRLRCGARRTRLDRGRRSWLNRSSGAFDSVTGRGSGSFGKRGFERCVFPVLIGDDPSGLGLRNRSNLFGIGYLENRSSRESVHIVSQKHVRIEPEHRHQHLIQRRLIRQVEHTDPTGRITGLDLDFFLRRPGTEGDRPGRWRRDGRDNPLRPHGLPVEQQSQPEEEPSAHAARSTRSIGRLDWGLHADTALSGKPPVTDPPKPLGFCLPNASPQGAGNRHGV